MTKKNEMWADQLKKGSANTFFNAFPDDEVLALQLNQLFPGEGEISSESIKRSRARFFTSPQRGDLNEEKIASPTKSVIRNKANQLNIDEAFAEIIDNIFDNYERNTSPTKPNVLSIQLLAYPEYENLEAEIVIKENSGGIPKDRVLSLIQLGSSDRGYGGIGAWGEGFKIAAFSLGQEIEVFSTYHGEESKAIYFPKGWLDESNPRWKDWKVDIYTVTEHAPTEGSTNIHIRYPFKTVVKKMGLEYGESSEVSKKYLEEITEYFAEIYAEKYHVLIDQGLNANISVTIGEHTKDVVFLDTVENRLKANLAFIPWLPPIKWQGSFEATTEDEGTKSDLQVTIYAGLAVNLEEYSSTYANSISQPGVEMWGNGRKFSLKERISDESAGWDYRFGGSGGSNPKSGPSYRRIMIVALFSSGDSRNIPWAAPVKNDYNRRSHFYAEIKDALARAIRLYKDAHRLLDTVIQPSSSSWYGLPEDEKISVLFKDVKVSDEFLDEFCKTRFWAHLASYRPSTIFKTVSGEIPTAKSTFGIPTSSISEIVKAAQESKGSPEERVRFLKAIFPTLDKQALIEEKLQLKQEEELAYDS